VTHQRHAGAKPLGPVQAPNFGAKTGFEAATLTLAIRSSESAHLELSESVQLRGSKECAGV
jgi:hypothetical protein